MKWRARPVCRRRVGSFYEPATDIVCLALTTGPSPKGIGAETALSLASANPSRIILAGRSEARTKPAMDQIEEMNPKIAVVIVPLDNTSVRQAAKAINSNIDFLDILFNSPGVMAITDYTKSADQCSTLVGSDPGVSLWGGFRGGSLAFIDPGVDRVCGRSRGSSSPTNRILNCISFLTAQL
jgi:NAD(P)-dependent dehydrogenase (short-subunit alcohol dehydrogenase family)